jgi:glycosyltransferase involved in cell wall biosynthesis
MDSSHGTVVFAHVPPPHHGQSRMVQLMLDGLRTRGSAPAFYHVDARVSESLSEVGGASARKIHLLLGYVLQALAHRLKHGARTLYYIPAPAKKSAILRDVVALSLLRPFFPRLILHWHAVGLGAWVHGSDEATEAPQGVLARVLRPLLLRLLRDANLSIVIAPGNISDAEVFAPRKIMVIPNGIQDPCPDFPAFSERRQARAATIKHWLDGTVKQPSGEMIRVLYLGHCLRSKGYFDALEGTSLAASQRNDLRWKLDIAGSFLSSEEETESGICTERLHQCGVDVTCHGFLAHEQKAGLLRDSDVMLFPSRSESFGLVAVEALAFGLPVVGSDIPGIRAVLADTGCVLVPPRNPQALADAMCRASSYVDGIELRRKYAEDFTLEIFQQRMAKALL